MIKKIIISTFLFSASAVFAQQLQTDNTQSTALPSTKKIEVKEPEVNFSQEQINQMSSFLSKADYQNFYNIILSSKVSKNNYISYLLSKQNEGIIPTYWLIADFYAKEKNFYETHKWFYISLIMTQQDSYLCKDITAKNSPRKLMEFFPESVHVTRVSPQHIENSMREVSFFITNLKTRIDPSWVCYYGEKIPSDPQNILINKSFWKQERDRVFRNFVEKYQK